jgi:hypothetical protein
MLITIFAFNNFILKYLPLFFVLIVTTSLAQTKVCGSAYKLNKYLENNTEILSKRENLEKLTNKFNFNNKSNLTIPVVVHIVYKNTSENISNTQIQSQLDVLSQDFTRTNFDAFNTPSAFLPVVADMQISFCLAQQDPNGNPTDGIIRKQTTNSFFPLYGDEIFFDSLGGSNAWDTESYLNIWVCMVEPGILGWAQLPAGGSIETDGVVIDYEHFGTNGTAISPYNLGRTATHEVGHWFNLFHIWGDNLCGDDLVNDTPTQEEGNFGCKIHPHLSCNNTGDMFMNFMDYTNDNCMNSFTEGQKTRVWSSIMNFRSGLILSNGCLPATIPNSDAGISNILVPNNTDTNCTNPIIPKVILTNYGNTTLNSINIKYSINSGTMHLYSWNGSLNSNESDTLILPSMTSSGASHFLSVSTYLPNNSTDINPSNDEYTKIFSSIDGSSITFTIHTDNYANETSWKLINENNDLIFSEDNLSNNTLYLHDACLGYGCYKFIINDSYGDGFCCDFGNGYLQISSLENNNIIASLSQFQFTDTTLFCIGITEVNNIKKDLIFYPNPTKHKIYIKNDINNENSPIFALISDNLGKIISKKVVNNELDVSELANGMYHLTIEINNSKYIQKLIIQK